MQKALLAFVLHAHLPFVRHPEYPRFLEETWLFEGISETYLPLLRVFERLRDEGIPFRITFSVSPTLAFMLRDDLLRDRYETHLGLVIDLAHKEAHRTRNMPEFHRLALMYLDLYQRNLSDFRDKYNRDLLSVLADFQESGHLELITTSATHAFLPVLEAYPKAIRAQIKTAVDFHTEVFGHRPRGFWLPECGYFPGVETYLEEHGLGYFFVDSHGLAYADPAPKRGVFAPVTCPGGAAVFGRDPTASRSIWSLEEGYPGDISYREFYRDIGFDLPLEDLRGFAIDGTIRMNTGLKYYAVTGRGDVKTPYNREEALRKVDEHADNFLYRQQKQAEKLSTLLDRPPLTVAPYDAELFGHWWFEGPQWIEALIRKIHEGTPWLDLTTPQRYLKEFPENQTTTPSASSWGNKGYSTVWLNGSNDWIYPHIHKAVDRMSELAQRFASCDGMRRRILNQAAREVLLMQASDWSFIMRAGTTVGYAVKRTREHIYNFNRIYDAMLSNKLELEWISQIERKNNLFPDMDYSVFA